MDKQPMLQQKGYSKSPSSCVYHINWVLELESGVEESVC
jgi:hypothetical protein